MKCRQKKLQLRRKLWWEWKLCGSERERSCWVSMICQWVSRAICWLSQTVGDCNYPGAEGGKREACSVNRLPLLLCMDVAHSQGPHSCMSTTSYWMWLLNLFSLGVFSVCNQYTLLLQCAAGTAELQGWCTVWNYYHYCHWWKWLKFLLLSRQGSSKVIIGSEPFITFHCKVFLLFSLNETIKTKLNVCVYSMCCALFPTPSAPSVESAPSFKSLLKRYFYWKATLNSDFFFYASSNNVFLLLVFFITLINNFYIIYYIILISILLTGQLQQSP